jgi:hypothetical protein
MGYKKYMGSAWIFLFCKVFVINLYDGRLYIALYMLLFSIRSLVLGIFAGMLIHTPGIYSDSLIISAESNPLTVYRKLKNGASGMSRLSDLPLYISSEIAQRTVVSYIVSETDIPYKQLNEKITKPSVWCDIAMLHLNIKSCIYRNNKITFYAGKKHYQTPDDASLFQYTFQVKQSSPDITSVSLFSHKGPAGTSDHRIELVAVPSDGKAVLRFTLSFQGSILSSNIADLYFATAGSSKSGFTYSEKSGRKELVGGIKGAIERNSMRYYLALLVCFQDYEAKGRMSAIDRASLWFDYTERYRHQLHEVEKKDYLSTKMKEFSNQTRLQNAVNEKQTAYLFPDK